MYRHDLDPIALVFGALFTVLGLAYVVGHWSWFDFRSGWILAALLIALGLAGVFSAARRASRKDDVPSEPTTAPATATGDIL